LPKRKTVIGAGFLCIALTLVVMFTSPAAFRSPAAVVVMALIGAAAVLLQIQLRSGDHPSQVRSPLWLNTIGIALTIGALFPSAFHLGTKAVQAMVLGAVGSFAISSAILLHSFRKSSAKSE
jgi:peptidoglycan/LPS O-acetylase OafA/YrhL